MEYTKGEWKSYHDSMTARDAVCAEDGVGFFTKEVCRVRGDTQAEVFANCNLIAAAPDMYEALKTANKLLTACCASGIRIAQSDLDKIDKALAKVEEK